MAAASARESVTDEAAKAAIISAPRPQYPSQASGKRLNAKAGIITVQGPTGTGAIFITDNTGFVKHGQRVRFSEMVAGDNVRGSATVRPPGFRAVAKWITITTVARR